MSERGEDRLERREPVGFWGRLKEGLRKSRTDLLERVDAALAGRGEVDEETLESLEEALIAADLGVDAALDLVARVKSRANRREAVDAVKLRQMLADEMAILLLDAPRPPGPGSAPRLTLVVGVNGTGKTTSAAKLARWSELRGEKALLAAADTFRAAAVEQLTLWGERLGVDVVRQPTGSDAAAVVYDAIQAARARGVRHLIVDTAGRLHTKDHLMAELAKIKRVVDREAGDFERHTLLVLDATTGQNAIAQSREFSRAAGVDGVLLAKLDGTAKGGMAVAVARDLELPVLYLGVGEGVDDLVEFRAREFAAALLGDPV
jgi:fused signal recognition particle receptor